MAKKWAKEKQMKIQGVPAREEEGGSFSYPSHPSTPIAKEQIIELFFPPLAHPSKSQKLEDKQRQDGDLVHIHHQPAEEERRGVERS